MTMSQPISTSNGVRVNLGATETISDAKIKAKFESVVDIERDRKNAAARVQAAFDTANNAEAYDNEENTNTLKAGQPLTDPTKYVTAAKKEIADSQAELIAYERVLDIAVGELTGVVEGRREKWAKNLKAEAEEACAKMVAAQRYARAAQAEYSAAAGRLTMLAQGGLSVRGTRGEVYMSIAVEKLDEAISFTSEELRKL
jgi:hypothetical protein